MKKIKWAGKEFWCLPDRALWWPSASALILADLHAGKDDTFRRAGVPMPAGSLDADLARLDRAIRKTCPSTLIILGDLFHAREGRTPRVLQAMGEWRSRWQEIDFILVRGNHDRCAGDPPVHFDMRVVPELTVDGILLRHACTSAPKKRRGTVRTTSSGLRSGCSESTSLPIIAGHLHPVCCIGAGRMKAVLPCFWMRADALILPAFTELAGGFRIRLAKGERAVLVTPDGTLLDWPPWSA